MCLDLHAEAGLKTAKNTKALVSKNSKNTSYGEQEKQKARSRALTQATCCPKLPRGGSQGGKLGWEELTGMRHAKVAHSGISSSAAAALHSRFPVGENPTAPATVNTRCFA